MRKNHFFLFVLYLFCGLSLGFLRAQKPKKASLTKADVYFQSGKLDLAKEYIDLVMAHPKKGKRLNAYLLHAQIYRALLLTDDFTYRKLAEKPGVIAAKSFEQVMKMEADRRNSQLYVMAFNSFEELWGHHLQQAIDYYNIEDYPKAYEEFLNTLAIKPEDSISLSYAGYVARLNKHYDQVLLHYGKLIELGKASLDVHKVVVNLERIYKKDLDRALYLARQAQTLFEEEPFFRKEELIMLIQQDKKEEINAQMRAIKAQKIKDAELFLFMASFYEDQADPFVQQKDYRAAASLLDSAIVYYKQSIELTPDQLTALFNLALAYHNIAQQYYQLLQDMDQDAYAREGDIIEKKGDVLIAEALPYLEKAHRLAPQDIDVLSALGQSYYLLDMREKEQIYKEKLKTLEETRGNE